MKTIKFRENPSPEELLKQLLGDGWRMEFHRVLETETLRNPSLDIVECKRMCERIYRIYRGSQWAARVTNFESRVAAISHWRWGCGERSDKRSGEVSCSANKDGSLIISIGSHLDHLDQ